MKRKLLKLLSKVLISGIILLALLIYVKKDKENYDYVYNIIYKNNINMVSIKNFFSKYVGSSVLFEKFTKSNTELVSSEKLIYKSKSIYLNGVKLETDDNYLVPNLKSGMVVFIGDKDNFNNTIIIQQVDGINVWYGNMHTIAVSLYDYIDSNEFLGEVSKELYIQFEKDGKYLDYNEYIT